MLSIVKGILIGVVMGFKWYGRRIKESKWYILPLIVDVVLIPLKIVVIPIVCCFKQGRTYCLDLGYEFLDD
jgi:hypothetical protein